VASTKRGKAPRQARAKATVEAIVEATGQVFEREGFRRTTTALVAERAGVSVGSLYQYFPDKQALIAAFFEQRLAQDLELMERVASRAEGASPVTLLRVVTEEMVSLYRRDRALYLSVVEILPLAEQTRELREGLERAVAMAALHLGSYPELHRGRDPELLALVIVHALRSALFRIVERDVSKLDDPALPAILVGGVLGFLGLPPDAP
jgi:AcrR family transcriptional regulator